MSAARPPRLRDAIRELKAVPLIAANFVRPAAKQRQMANGIPLLVIPGMLTTDRSTSLLRRSLERAGFSVYRWGQGLNFGVRKRILEALEQRVISIAAREGRPVIVLGWSLGGLYARVLGQRLPTDVCMVVTLCAPFSGDRRANRAWRLYELINRHKVDRPPVDDDPAVKPGVPTIAVWVLRDGVVAPACARGNDDESDERIELNFTHFEIGSSKKAIQAVVDIVGERAANLN